MPVHQFIACTASAIAATALLTCAAFAQRTNAPDARRWGVEADLVQPFIPEVHIITVKATRTVAGDARAAHGDVMFGVYARPNITHDVVTRIREYMGSIGYRQFLARGLHTEAQYYAGYVWGERNRLDGKDYDGVVQFAEVNVGYRIPIGRGDGRRVYVAPQFGYLQGLNDKLIIGPRNGKSDGFVQGKLLVGYSF